jgi:hypothetical protein
MPAESLYSAYGRPKRPRRQKRRERRRNRRQRRRARQKKKMQRMRQRIQQLQAAGYDAAQAAYYAEQEEAAYGEYEDPYGASWAVQDQDPYAAYPEMDTMGMGPTDYQPSEPLPMVNASDEVMPTGEYVGEDEYLEPDGPMGIPMQTWLLGGAAAAAAWLLLGK